MSKQAHRPPRAVQGTIRRRLLVNALVDPDEVARQLPPGVRPHLTADGTVVGCCLLEISAMRPAGVPAIVGRRIRATAHRISVDWEDASGEVVAGVYVPVRQSDSRLAAALGGRWVPGVHERARIEVHPSDHGLQWRSEPLDSVGLGIRIAVSLSDDALGLECDPVGVTCLEASVGLSPDRRGHLEGARMDPSHRDARAVTVEALESEFLDSFSTARLSTALLMCDADVTWTRAAAPTMTLGSVAP